MCRERLHGRLGACIQGRVFHTDAIATTTRRPLVPDQRSQLCASSLNLVLMCGHGSSTRNTTPCMVLRTLRGAPIFKEAHAPTVAILPVVLFVSLCQVCRGGRGRVTCPTGTRGKRSLGLTPSEQSNAEGSSVRSTDLPILC